MSSQEGKMCFFYLLLCRIQIKELDPHLNRKLIWSNLNNSLKSLAHRCSLVSIGHFKVIRGAYITVNGRWNRVILGHFLSHLVHQHTWHVPSYASWCPVVANFCDHVTAFLCDPRKILHIQRPCLSLNTQESDIQLKVAGGKKLFVMKKLYCRHLGNSLQNIAEGLTSLTSNMCDLLYIFE